MTVPLMAVLFLPSPSGCATSTPGPTPSAVGRDAVDPGTRPAYLNVDFFLVRAAIYFALWIGLALLLDRWSSQQDRTEDAAPTRRLQAAQRAGAGARTS